MLGSLSGLGAADGSYVTHLNQSKASTRTCWTCTFFFFFRALSFEVPKCFSSRLSPSSRVALDLYDGFERHGEPHTRGHQCRFKETKSSNKDQTNVCFYDVI